MPTKAAKKHKTLRKPLKESVSKHNTPSKVARRIVATAQSAASDNIKRFAKLGPLKLKQSLRAVDQSVNDRPWQYLAGCASGAAVIGFLLGRRKRNTKNSETAA